MVSLIDTNVLVRFLVNDDEAQHQKSREIIAQVETGASSVELLSEVIMEVLFVMTKYYGADLGSVAEDMKTFLSFPGVANRNKHVLIVALDTMVEKKIDYVDALICAKKQLQGYGWISFDHDLQKHCP
jgi:predicted nucleic-acid-binding protein